MNEQKRLQSVRKFVLLVGSLTLIAFCVALFLFVQTRLSKMMLEVEDEYLLSQRDVVEGSMAEAGLYAARICDDISIWDQTVMFVQGSNPNFISENWTDVSILQAYQFNFLCFKDAEGNNIYSDFYDYINNKPLQNAPEGFYDYLDTISRQVIKDNSEMTSWSGNIMDLSSYGIIFFDDVPYYISCFPIKMNREDQEVAGTLTIGYMLTNDYFRDLTHFESIDFALHSKKEAETILRENNSEHVVVSIPLDDINGEQVWLTMTSDRHIYNNGIRVLHSTALLIMLTCIGFFALLYLLLQHKILRPLEHISHDISNLGENASFDPEKYKTSEEFYSLGRSVSNMLENIKQSNVSLTTLQNVLNSVDSIIYVSDPKTDEILFANQKMFEQFGPAEDIIGRPCWQVVQTGRTERCENCPIFELEKHPDKKVQWEGLNSRKQRYYHNTDLFIDWPDYEYVHVQNSVDITDSKNAERSLQNRLKQQELMSAISSNFIATDDIDTLISQAMQMTGEFMDIDKMAILELDRENQQLHIRYNWESMIDDGSTHAMGTRNAFSDGNPFFDAFCSKKAAYLYCNDTSNDADFVSWSHYGVLSFLAVPVTVNGAFWGAIVIDSCTDYRNWSQSDISLASLISNMISSVIMRDATNKQLMRMSSIVNSSPQYISYLNPNGECTYVNSGAELITGYSADELMAGSIRMLFKEEQHFNDLQTALTGIATGDGHVLELPILHKSGQEKILLFHLFTIGGGELGIGIIAVDITERRQLERELLEAKELAEQASRAKGDFLSRMSHEMRTPMNAIIGMTNIAQSTDDIEKKSYCLDKVGEASTHLLGVINDILDMSKIEAGKFELSFTEFDFEKMLIKTIDVSSFRLNEKHQTLLTDIDHNIPRFILSDEQHLAQVVANLLSNAVKFTPEEGTITLKAKLLSEDASGLTLLLEVTDTGIGILPQDQSKLFHLFEQADGGISRKYGGTGLGLAISKNIVELLGGDIWVSSNIGQGSTFSFTFKAQRSQAPQASLLPEGVNWGNLRVLVVDDSPEVCEYFAHLFSSLGVNCLTADGAAEAQNLLAAAELPFNIIFVDWQMPDMNGIDLTRWIRQNSSEQSVVIMISATEWSQIENDAKEAGVNIYLPKPIFPSLIVDCINQCLGLRLDTVESENETDEQPDFTDAFRGNTVLLAEDIDINREIVLAMLQDTGLAIECAETGAEACSMFAANPKRYDMIFMDIHMPEMDGYQATRSIRAMNVAEAQSIPIVAMTANVFREDIEKCLAAGMNDHVGKPLDYMEVIGKLQKHLPEKTD